MTTLGVSARVTGIFNYLPQLPSRNRRHDCIVFTQGLAIINNQELWCYIMSTRKIFKRNNNNKNSNNIQSTSNNLSRTSSSCNFQSEINSSQSDTADLDSDDLSSSTIETSML